MSARDRAKEGTQREIVDHLTMSCPFCSGTFTAGTDKGTGYGVVLHTMPFCKTFDRLDPVEFVSAVSKRVQS